VMMFENPYDERDRLQREQQGGDGQPVDPAVQARIDATRDACGFPPPGQQGGGGGSVGLDGVRRNSG
jgi:hypothetical protein